MSTFTVVGKVTDALGHAHHVSYGWEGRAACEYRQHSALPAAEYRSRHASPLPIRRSHGARQDIGRCVHLERSAADDIVAVAVVDAADDLLTTHPGTLYWSPELRYRRVAPHDIEITELVITDSPATFALTPLELIPGDAHRAADFVRCRHRPTLAGLLDRAEAAHRRRSICGPITIEDPTALKTEQLPDGTWIDGRGNRIPVTGVVGRAAYRTEASQPPAGLHRSNSGRRTLVEGRWVEIEYSKPYNGVLSVR